MAPIPFLSFRKSNIEPLPVSMCGVRMGERALQIGADDPQLLGTLAAKVGLSGHAVVVVADDAAGNRAKAAGEHAGALVEIHAAPWHALPLDAGSFDVAIVHGTRGLLSELDESTRLAALREFHRVLRNGGRLIIIESGPGGGLSSAFRPKSTATTATAALATAGFKATRVLAAREGYTFTEGLKG